MEEVNEDEPLYTYRRISRPSVRISDQYCLGVLSLQEVEELFHLDFEEIGRIYQRCFIKKTKGLSAILSIFSNKDLLKIINYFVVFTVISHNEKLRLHASHIIEQIKLKINNLYKQIMSKLRNHEINCFSLSLFIGFFTSYFLIKFQFFDKQSDNIEFLYYCVEIVHTRFYGNFINSEVLYKYILHIFGSFFEMKRKRRSIISLALPRSDFEQYVGTGNFPTKKPTSPSKFVNASKYNSEHPSLILTIKDQFSKLNNNYEKLTDEFVDLMKVYTKFQKRKKEFAVVQKKPERVIDQKSKQIGININGLGSALHSNTHNHKKDYCVTFRNLSRRAQFEFSEGVRKVSRQLQAFKDSCDAGNNSLDISSRTTLASKKAFSLQKILRHHKSQISVISEQPDLFNEFEKNIKEMDTKFEKAQKYLSVVQTARPNKQFVSQINESDFDTLNQFYLKLKREKEIPANQVFAKDYSVRKLMLETDRKKNLSYSIARDGLKREKQVSSPKKQTLPTKIIRRSMQEKLPTVQTIVPKKKLLSQLKRILELNPASQQS